MSNTMTVYRGDSFNKWIVLKNKETGEQINLEEGDTIYFTVKRTTEEKSKVLQKVITDFIDGRAFLNIKPEDTRELTPGEFIYDIQYTRKDGYVKTIVRKSPFVLEGDVTHE